MKLRFGTWLPWILFVGWFLLLGLLLVGIIASGEDPVDYKTYRLAAEAVERSESPYGTPAESQAIWADIHRLSSQLVGERPAPGDLQIQSGPYIYSPILALLISQLRLKATLFVAFVFVAIIGFGWLWLRTSRVRSFAPSAWWLLLVVASWDVAASYLGLNIELILLALGLLAAWLLWSGRGLLAALPIAFAVLIKPFFTLLIVAFGLLMLIQRQDWRGQMRVLAIAAIGTLLLVLLEVLRWPGWLREESFAYLRNALAHQWLVLPLSEQTPMSIWNRTPLQVFVNLGIDAAVAQWMAILLWGLLLLATLWWTRRRSLSFALTFGLAYVLFLWGRPVSWTLPYLEFIVLLAVWPFAQKRWQRAALLTAALLLMSSHWLAFFRTVQGINANLFTLQTDVFPWETLLVLPLSWLIILVAARQEKTLLQKE